MKRPLRSLWTWLKAWWKRGEGGDYPQEYGPWSGR